MLQRYPYRKKILCVGSTILIPSLLLTVLATTPGCSRAGKNQGAIGGEVKLDGTPVERGSIAFTPMEGTSGTATGGQIENGRYYLPRAKGPSIGWNRVEIRVPRKTGRKIPKGFGATGEMVEEETEAVATRFNSASTLKTEVAPGDNTANFDVASK